MSIEAGRAWLPALPSAFVRERRWWTGSVRRLLAGEQGTQHVFDAGSSAYDFCTLSLPGLGMVDYGQAILCGPLLTRLADERPT